MQTETKPRKNKQKLLVENPGLFVKSRERKEPVVTILLVQAGSCYDNCENN